ncbi:MAG TPA: ribose-phosphate pyrophosphokinase [Gillisia sp.]|nr:ribose-phosphate pyrophosphokinase [Gillisia sp.]
MKKQGTILFALPGNEELTEKLIMHLNVEKGVSVIRQFPDGETYVQIQSDVKNKRVILVCTLHQPDNKFLPLYFLSKTAKDLGAESICLVAPYLAYMRQDKRFHTGEGITSKYFGKLVPSFADSLISVDPHLHRKKSLNEVYNIPNKIIHSANLISEWIKMNIKNPVLIGPDSESKQWVSKVAKDAEASFIVLEKTRLGDRKVLVSLPEVDAYKNHTPVLIDDIISTAGTMIETTVQLKKAGMKPPVCIGIHAVFAENAYQDLLNAGVADIITSNTIPHKSNRIDISKNIAEAIGMEIHQV